MVILREEEERACVLVDVVNWGRENLIVSVKAGEASRLEKRQAMVGWK